MKPKKLILRRLNALGHEAMALVHQMVARAVVEKQGMAYRLKIPYNKIDPFDRLNDGNLLIDVSVYYDGEFKEEPNEQRKNFKVTGADKGRH